MSSLPRSHASPSSCIAAPASSTLCRSSFFARAFIIGNKSHRSTFRRIDCSLSLHFSILVTSNMSPAPKLNKIFSDKIPELSEKEEDLLHQVKNVRTTPRDNRFPSSNQALHCWNRYNEWLLCLKETGKDEDKCQVYRQYANSICPGDWTANWDEAREEGTFAGLKV